MSSGLLLVRSTFFVGFCRTIVIVDGSLFSSSLFHGPKFDDLSVMTLLLVAVL